MAEIWRRVLREFYQLSARTDSTDILPSFVCIPSVAPILWTYHDVDQGVALNLDI
jgi:hypothetical protein